MTSTLSSTNLNSLKLLSKFNENEINKIINLTFEVLINPNIETNLNEEESNAQIGIASLITLLARQASISEAIRPILKDFNIPENSINLIIKLYNLNIDIIRSKLLNISISYPKIIGCDWRLDYSVSNSESGSVLKPIFFIKLLIDNGSTIDFTCNEEEMTSFVTTLKDAVLEASRTTL